MAAEALITHALRPKLNRARSALDARHRGEISALLRQSAYRRSVLKISHLYVLAVSLALTAPALADTPAQFGHDVRKDASQVGHKVVEVGKESGHAVVHAAKVVGHGVASAAKSGYKATKTEVKKLTK